MSFLCLKDPLPWLIRLYLSLVTPPLLLPVSPISRMDTVLQSLARLSSVLPIPSSLNPSASSTNSTPKTDPQYVHLHCTVFVQGTYFLLRPAAQGMDNKLLPPNWSLSIIDFLTIHFLHKSQRKLLKMSCLSLV